MWFRVSGCRFRVLSLSVSRRGFGFRVNVSGLSSYLCFVVGLRLGGLGFPLSPLTRGSEGRKGGGGGGGGGYHGRGEGGGGETAAWAH